MTTILITVENPDRTGAPRMVLQYARVLVEAGHRVLAATGPTSEGTSSILPDLAEAGVEVCPTPPFGPRSAGKALLHLRRVIRGEGVTCVVGSQQRDRVLACLAAGLTGTRCVVFAQNQHRFRGGRLERGMKERIYGWALRSRADMVICVSEAVEWEVRSRFGIEDDRTQVVLNGIDVEAFPVYGPDDARRARRELGISDDDHLLLNVGRIDPQKGQDLLIDAFRNVSDVHPRARLGFVGTAPGHPSGNGEEGYSARLRSRVRAGGLEDRVLFLGWRDDVPRLLAAADLYVQPSRWEGWPLALVEAMAAGCPIVASDCSGRPRGFLDGEHGWIVPTGDIESLGRSLEGALARGRGELEAMGRRARELAKRHYDIRQRSERFVGLVEEVAGR